MTMIWNFHTLDDTRTGPTARNDTRHNEALRRSHLFKKYREEWNVAHAEVGLVLMRAEAFLLAGLLMRGQIIWVLARLTWGSAA